MAEMIPFEPVQHNGCEGMSFEFRQESPRATFFMMIKIKVNGEIQEFSTAVSLSLLLESLQLSAGQGLALAVNEQVIARSKWPDFLLNDGDQVIIIKATAGG